jgi:hypothetical protein
MDRLVPASVATSDTWFSTLLPHTGVSNVLSPRSPKGSERPDGSRTLLTHSESETKPGV